MVKGARTTITASLALTLTFPCIAQQSTQVFGNFYVSTEPDPFYGGVKVVARTVGSTAIALRCIENTMSVAVSKSGHSWNKGDLVEVKFRRDNEDVLDFKGVALTEDTVGLYDSENIVNYIGTASSVAFRIESNTSTYSFRIQLSGVAAAADKVRMACNPDD